MEDGREGGGERERASERDEREMKGKRGTERENGRRECRIVAGGEGERES